MTYLERKTSETPLCTYPGCDLPPADDHLQCKGHRAEHRKRARASAQRRRDQLAAAGKCTQCGTPRKPGQRCVVCRARRCRIAPDDAVDNKVDSGGSAQSDQWRKDNDGWARYRGKGRRGAPAAGVNDEQDLRDALKALVAGQKALAYARSPEVQALPRIQRASVRREAAAFLAHAARFLDEVVERNEPKGRE